MTNKCDYGIENECSYIGVCEKIMKESASAEINSKGILYIAEHIKDDSKVWVSKDRIYLCKYQRGKR